MEDSEKKGRKTLKPKSKKKNKSGVTISSVKKEGFLNIGGNEGKYVCTFADSDSVIVKRNLNYIFLKWLLPE